MKPCLVFPPQIIPTSAPLGISLLKSYIEENTSQKVKNIDLNLYFHNQTINNFIEGKFSIYNDPEKNKNSIELIKKAVEIFKLRNSQNYEGFRSEASKPFRNSKISKRLGNSKNFQSQENKDFFNPSIYNPCANEFLYLFEKIFNTNKPLLYNYVNNKQDISAALEPFTKEITKESPNLIGFSILTTEQIYYTLALAKKLKQDLNTKIIIGGAAVRLFPEKFLKYPFIDFVINGDGEIALKELLEGKDKEEIKNIIYKENNKIVKNEQQNININETPPPDFSDFNLDDYFSPKRVLTTLTSRGCYWKKCTFCADYNAVSMQYRVKDTQKLIEELKFLKEKYQTDYFYFADEMISPIMFNRISQALINENLNIRYYTQARPKEFNLELLKQMKTSGCTAIMWGVESACQRILNLINKGTNIEEIENILKQSKEAKIKNAIYAFGGFPTESEEEYNKTIDWLKKNKELIDLQFTGLFRLTKNSRIEKNKEEFKISSTKLTNEDEFDPTYDYEVKEGISQKKSLELFNKNYTFLLSLNKFSPFLGKFRDHMLVYFLEND